MTNLIWSFLLLLRLLMKQQTVAEPLPSWLGWMLLTVAKQSSGSTRVAVEKCHAGARCLQGNKQIIFSHDTALLLAFLLVLTFYISCVKDMLITASTSFLHKEVLLRWCLSPLKWFIRCKLL